MKKYGFGVDVGGTTIKMGFFETDGTLLDKWEIKTNTANGGSEILPDIARSIDNKLAQEGISKSEVQGIGVGVPGKKFKAVMCDCNGNKYCRHGLLQIQRYRCDQCCRIFYLFCGTAYLCAAAVYIGKAELL